MKSNFSALKFVAIAALMACFTMGYAQCDQGNVYGQRGQKSGFAIVFGDSTGQHVVPTSAMTLPTFKGGNKAMCRYINKTKKYPVNLKNQKISGTTTVQAKVLKDSTLTDIEVVESSGYPEFDNEALRVVKSFPHMIPSTQSCEAQDMVMQIKVVFDYEEEVAADKKKAEMEEAKKDLVKPITLYFENDHQGNNDTWPFNKAFYPILNVAWGGDWGGYKGIDESALPLTMEVDYVRVWQKE